MLASAEVVADVAESQLPYKFRSLPEYMSVVYIPYSVTNFKSVEEYSISMFTPSTAMMQREECYVDRATASLGEFLLPEPPR